MNKIAGIFSFIWLFPLWLIAQDNQIVVHDPVAIESDGVYYVFNTGPGISNWKSTDMVNWESLNPVFEPVPEWFTKEVPRFNGHIWAPDISYHNGLYYLYYSVSSFGSNLSCIGVATARTLDRDSPDFGWTDHGKVVQSIPGRDDWNAIDPNLIFDENGTPWMAFGSFWSGIKMVKLSKDLLSIAWPQEWYALASRDRTMVQDVTEAGDGAVEAPFIFKKGDYYYLFVSFDLCCRGENSTYNVRVGRSKKVTGPYVDKEGKMMLHGGGTLVVKGDDDYYAKGHNSVYNFDGTDYFFMHGYLKKENGSSKLLISKLKWNENMWPYLEN